MQLHQGDTLILLSDGVEDAYEIGSPWKRRFATP